MPAMDNREWGPLEAQSSLLGLGLVAPLWIPTLPMFQIQLQTRLFQLSLHA